MRDLRDLLTSVLDAAASRVDYADARYVRTRTERIEARTGRVARLEQTEEQGIGVRARVGGAWGFAATRETDRTGVEGALSRALAIAGAEPHAPAASLAPEPPARGAHITPFERDPFGVPLADKLATLSAADGAMRSDPRVAVTSAHFVAFGEDKIFVSTEGAACEQRAVECGGGIACVAVSGGESQVRSYPGSHRGSVARAGYEHFATLDLEAHAPRVADEAVALLSAPPCPAGRSTVVLDGEQLALQVHESVGHAVELDRVLGTEASYAGTSFLSPASLGSFRYGSPLMNVTADATAPAGLGSFAWDDEGVAAQALPLVREGVLRTFLSSRESAAEIGLERSGGCMRAEGFARQPLVRMTNVSLEPGAAGSLEELIADTERGIYMETNRSWSIDSRRLRFQFATELAREISGGKLGRLLKNPTYAGTTPEFWAGLDAICSAPEWRLWSVLNCGKGEPGQAMHISHGTAPARFRDVRVGIA